MSQASNQAKLNRYAGVAILSLLTAIVLSSVICTKGYAFYQKDGRTVVKIAIPTWPGFTPGMIANKKNFFDHLTLKFKIIDDLSARHAAYRSGDIDILATSADMWILEKAQGLPGKIFLVTDESAGGDGIVCRSDINSITDLSGKRVAFARATPSHYLLFKALSHTGLAYNSVIPVKVEDPSAAAQAFLGDRVDAAVTWEPFLSKVKDSSKGKVLVTSKQFPGAIVGTLAASPKLLATDKTVLPRITAGWLKGVEYINRNPEECVPIIAKGLEIEPADVSGMMAGLKLADHRRNQEFFSEQSKKLNTIFNEVGPFWKDQGFLKSIPINSDLSITIEDSPTPSRKATKSGTTKNVAESAKNWINIVALSILVLIGVYLSKTMSLLSSLTFDTDKALKDKTEEKTLQVLSPIALVCLWILVSNTGLVSNKLLPEPFSVFDSFAKLLANGVLPYEASVSLGRVLIGFTGATVIGVPLGLLAGSFVLARSSITPINSFFRYIPPTAFVSLLIVYCGVGELFKCTVIFAGLIFFIIQMVVDAVEDFDKSYIEMYKVCGSSNLDTFKNVIIPATLPRILDILRINLSAAWTFLVVAELIGAESGLGHFISVSQRFMRLDDLYAGIIMFGIIGFLSDKALQICSRKLFKWYYISLKG